MRILRIMFWVALAVWLFLVISGIAAPEPSLGP